MGLIQTGKAAELTASPGHIYTLRDGKRPIANLRVGSNPKQSYRIGK
tara:strand:- start:18 stop:158 length:141 start_codon:yes stop_codon:yes gene_type:complete